MDSKFRELQQKLNQIGIPEFVSFLPNSLRSEEINSLLASLNNCTVAEVSKDNTLLPFISDYVGTPIKADLNTISKQLDRFPELDCDIFEKESTITARTTPQFTTARSISSDSKNSSANNSNNTVNSTQSESLRPKKECNVEEYILERIENEILETSVNVTWEDIVGLEDVKRVITEIIVWPMQRPDVFTGLRGPPKGLLLFGPPGTGKTLIGKCIASQCKATFFSISASSLTSKWVGEGEKMVRALFYKARKMAPSVIFIDEIDSLLSQRSENENEGSRRIKTEFLVQFDGASVDDTDRILVVGATNRPQEIDEAARRRLVKRIYVPLPELESRMMMVKQLIDAYRHDIDEEGLRRVGRETEGYSGSDMFSLCREASMEPLREIGDIHSFDPEKARAINGMDFITAMKQIRKSVSERDLNGYVAWNEQFGSMSQPQSSFYYESSTFLKSKRVPRPTTHVFFNFVLSSPLDQIKLFFITVIRKKYTNVFYGYDSSSFCLLKCPRELEKGRRYMIYGKLTKNKLYFLECLKEEEIDYKELCYMLL